MSRLLLAALFLVTASGPVACSRSAPAGTEGSPRVLVGAGATLPYPLYSKWADAYARVDPTVRVNYQSIGSGAGIRQVADGVIDFGATDEAMTEEQLHRTPAKLVQVPTTIGAVVFAFNLPGERRLSLSAELSADIFLGNVRRWDDERIRAINPGRVLPSEPITVVHRADGSGTSAALTTYLSAHNAAWRDTVGSGTSPRFPVGVGAKGNEGVTALVKATPLSIGYVELVYAHQAGLAMADVRNRAGNFIAPSLESVERATRSSADAGAATAGSGPAADGGAGTRARAVLGDAADPGAYPIAALSYVVVPGDGRDRRKAEALAKFLWWAVHDGQAFAHDLHYVPLPPLLVVDAESALRSLRAEGRPLGPPGG